MVILEKKKTDLNEKSAVSVQKDKAKLDVALIRADRKIIWCKTVKTFR